MTTPTITFDYRALGRDGTIERGQLTAPDRVGAVRQLEARDLLLVDMAPARQRHVRGRALPMSELAVGMRVMAELLDSGMPIGRVLGPLEGMVSPRFAAIVPGVRAAVREGHSLADALSRAAGSIPPEVIGIIRAGERGSGLHGAMRQAAELCEQAAATRAALRSALAYPALLLIFGTGAVALLVGVVLPRFAAILGGMGQALPATTRVVLETAALATRAAPVAGIVSVAVVLAHAAWVRTPAGRQQWHEALLRLPWLGDTRRASASARWCATLGALLDNGVPIAKALQYAAEASADAAIGARVLAARQDVAHGERLSHALATHDVTTAIVRQLVNAGEETGRLARMLAHAGRLERDRAARRIATAATLIEPALIIGFGGLVALVTAALLQALYSVRPA